MASNPQTGIKVTLRDQSGESSAFTINVASPIDMSTLPAGFTSLITALSDDLTLGTFIRYNQTTTRRIVNTAEGGGNREDKALLIYEDNVTKKVYTAEVPCRKTTLTTAGVGTDSVPPAEWANVKTAWDAFAKSPDGNATTLLDVKIVGRNI